MNEENLTDAPRAGEQPEQGHDASAGVALDDRSGAEVGEALGERLVAREKLTSEELNRALRMQRETGERLGALLVNVGFVSERDLAEVLAEHLRLPLAQPADYRGISALNTSLSAEFLQRARLIPLRETDHEVVLAMADPSDDFAAEAVRLAVGKPVVRQVGVAADIEAARRRAYADQTTSMGQLVESIGDDDALAQGDVEQLRDLASEAPIIRVVNLIIADALDNRSSDIHVEPFESRLHVRYRIDGVLKTVEAPPAQSAAAVVSRIKVMANLNIAERRLPQDGRFKLRIEGREIDMRVSTVPTIHGESVVMRILDKASLPLDFPSLGFTPAALERFETVLQKPNGIVLVTGPTGSGKTTTLYAALSQLNTPEKKVLTVEDPVEYQLEGINQIQVKPQIGLGFADALRAILRQDPDVIMVGEMRDLETAKMAVQSALTGHQVFSTLHTNDAVSSVTRLLDMGVEDFLVTSTVSGVLAQRLVRRLCMQCREAFTPTQTYLGEVGFAPGTQVRTLYRPVGCEACDGTGYRGRFGILELLVMNEAVRQAILARADASGLREAAVASGMTTMYADGLAKAAAGVTTVEEIVRVTRDA